MQTGELVVLRRSERGLDGFTAYKVYTVCSGENERNISTLSYVNRIVSYHTSRTFNVQDDNGIMRFVTDQHFKPFNSELGLFK